MFVSRGYRLSEAVVAEEGVGEDKELAEDGGEDQAVDGNLFWHPLSATRLGALSAVPPDVPADAPSALPSATPATAVA